jgi:hypothetical protein
MHLSCIKSSTISKWTETSFHLSLVTSKYHRVHPKRLLSQWYVWCKLCTYLALTLTLSPNGPKRDLTWPTSPRGSIGYVQNNLWAYRTFSATHATILRQDYHYLQMDRNELPLEPRQLRVPSGASKTISEPMVYLVQTCAPILLWHWHRHGMDRNKTPHEPQNLGVPSALSETISKPMVRLVQTMHLSCTDTNTISK